MTLTDLLHRLGRIALLLVVLALCALLASCTMGPLDAEWTRTDGSSGRITYAGGSVLTKSARESSTVTRLADGSVEMDTRTEGKDEVAPMRYKAWEAIGGGIADEISPTVDSIVD